MYDTAPMQVSCRAKMRSMRILVVDDRFESRWGLADWLVAFL